MDYNMELDLSSIQHGHHVVIVDFSLKPDIMRQLRKITNGIVWIDHHVTAKEYPYQDLLGLRNFEDKAYSGCELTWMYYYPDSTMPKAIELIGDYDKWALKLPDSTAFHEGMKLYQNDCDGPIWTQLIKEDNQQDLDQVEKIILDGKIAMLYRDNYCDDLCKAFGYETSIAGHEAYACNQFKFGSGGFGHKFHQYPICIAYIHDGKKFSVSLYSETVDVSEIAKTYGGGGHKGAAGFTCMTLPFVLR
jgi:uncharacterized protein